MAGFYWTSGKKLKEKTKKDRSASKPRRGGRDSRVGKSPSRSTNRRDVNSNKKTQQAENKDTDTPAPSPKEINFTTNGWINESNTCYAIAAARLIEKCFDPEPNENIRIRTNEILKKIQLIKGGNSQKLVEIIKSYWNRFSVCTPSAPKVHSGQHDAQEFLAKIILFLKVIRPRGFFTIF